MCKMHLQKAIAIHGFAHLKGRQETQKTEVENKLSLSAERQQSKLFTYVESGKESPREPTLLIYASSSPSYQEGTN